MRTEKNTKLNYKKIIFWSLVAFFILAAVLFVWLLAGKATNAKRKVLENLPLPIALINNKPIYAKDFFKRYDLAKNFLNPTQDSEELKKQIKDRLAYEEKVKQTAKSKNVSVDQKQLEKEYELFAQAYQMQTGESLENALIARGINDGYFKNKILGFNVLLKNLALWHNTQKDLNQKPYRVADFLMQELNGGADFAGLASMYSQDENSKAFEGDLGYVEIFNLLFELQEPIDTGGAGKVLVLPSSLGLHIIKIEDKDNIGEQGGPRAHLRQIFLNTEDFNKWLETQIKTYKTKTIINV